ncbi:dual specificity tyrosine-phosphorylation-regulated kinase 2-like [Lethenteron reissneri]|uniref:dual specificity tyrosine-phosphorylation-regulated kinase 2-like n=1 Tax=Lethenteron reissneri TaxID=7753 RepID=UPI002AB74E24|nr:dual specificity tyrosine-phosphorylation-regulated kinase 2-like [Lethenteron reissneri]
MEISRAGEARSNGESCTTWSALSSARTSSIRSKSPQAILALFGPQMTHREKLELAAIQEVWYFALRNRSRGPNNDGYDDHEHHYIPVQHEHLHYRYEVLKKIGYGGQGQVIRCLDHMRNTLVAVKILVSPLSSKRDKFQRMEIKMALALQGEGSDEDYNVVKVLKYFDFRGHHCIVLELLKESLHDVIKEAGLRQLHMGMVKTYTRGILKFLCHTKARSIIHADIKPENVLIKDTVTGTIRVTDFGTSFFVKSQPLYVGGTRPFQSPEVLLGYRLTCAVDMWALGCTVAELVTGRELFQSDSRDDHLPCCMEILGLPPRCMMDAAPDGMHYFDRVGMMFCPVKRRVPGSLSLHGALNSHDPEFVDFVSSCLRWDPDCRMTPAQALGHSWLRTAATSTTSTTSNATTTATPGSVQCFGAAERRAEPALPPSSALAQASKWLTVVVEEEETPVEELLVQEEETLVEELVVQEEKTLVEELVVQEEETLVEELVG